MDRLGSNFRYAINASKIKDDLNWEPNPDIDFMQQETVMWYVKNKKTVKNINYAELLVV